MAELALAITGIALAWKGILDFGQLMSKLLDDDTRQRDILAIRLETSQHMLKDWGDHWGIDSETGRFHSFEPSRKELISRIIYRLGESRCEAAKKLSQRFDIANDEVEKRGASSVRGLSKTMDKIVKVAKRSKDKSRWVVYDRESIAALVKETIDLHACLASLASIPPPFLVANLSTLQNAPALESSLAQLENSVKKQQYTSSGASEHHTPSPQLAKEIDEQTISSYASSAIISSEQAESVKNHIDLSYHFHGDTRVTQRVVELWNDDRSSILILEVSDSAEDRTSTSACVLLYSLVECHKLIFIFDSESDKGPAQQFLDMNRTLIMSLLSLIGDQPLEEISLQISIADMENETVETANTPQLIGVFHTLLRQLLTASDRRVLLIIDGFELSGLNDEKDGLDQLVILFVKGLHAICENESEGEAHLKALIGCKGYATALYDCVGDFDVADFTDRAVTESCMREDMELLLHD